MTIRYLEPNQRGSDGQYQGLIRQVVQRGVWQDTQLDTRALTLHAQTLDYNMRNGFPIVTERDLVTPRKSGRSFFSQAVGEILAFINGARTIEELETFGCFWWKKWVTEEKCKKRGLPAGDLGEASYGAVWTKYPSANGPFNQIDAVIEQMRQHPILIAHTIDSLFPPLIYRIKGHRQGVVVVPCHGQVEFLIDTRTRGLTLIHKQRSADVLVGLPANLIGYGVFGLIMANLLGYTFERMVFFISTSRIYEVQLDHTEMLMAAKSSPLSTVTIQNPKDKLTDYRFEDFDVSDYQHDLGWMVIPTPV